MPSSFPETLRHLRLQAGFSLKEVSARLGVHFTTISGWERGRSEPSLAGLQDLARLYNTDVDGLIHGGAATGGADAFRPISSRSWQDLLHNLEELRLGICLGRALSTPEGAARLSAATGMATSRLEEIAAGRTVMRPSETAALVRELGAAGTADLFSPAPSETQAALPPATATAVAEILDRLYLYLGGRPSRQ
jgi:transcriptional regulator with XRE-family HTH domain